ncbi:MAG: transporter [Planctomycetaceae bacterium]|nr:transporter [Planctomycetaceae bacterium]
MKRAIAVPCRSLAPVILRALLLAGLALGSLPGLSLAQETTRPWAELFNGTAERSVPRGNGDEHLETDRDSFTPATTLVGRGRTMLETSYSFIDNRRAADTHSFPELLVRHGVTDWLELRLGANYEVGGGGETSGSEIGASDESAHREEESNVLYGFKIAVTEQDEWLPRSALIVHAITPTSGASTATQVVTGYVAGWTLPNGWDLDTSLRYVAGNEDGDHFNQWAPSVVLKMPAGECYNVHVEYFGIFADNAADNRSPQYISPGIHYLISPDLEIGVRVGWGLNNDAAAFFSNVGLGVRF